MNRAGRARVCGKRTGKRTGRGTPARAPGLRRRPPGSMSEPPVFKRGAVRRSGSAVALDDVPAVLPPASTPSADGVAVGSRRPLSPPTGDAAREADGEGSAKRRKNGDVEGAAGARRADGDPFAFEGSEAAAPVAAPAGRMRSALHLSGTPRVRNQVRLPHARCAQPRTPHAPLHPPPHVPPFRGLRSA